MWLRVFAACVCELLDLTGMCALFDSNLVAQYCYGGNEVRVVIDWLRAGYWRRWCCWRWFYLRCGR